jgi:hypothetical protein
MSRGSSQKLSNRELERRLLAYAVAGAGIVALGPNAAAQIIYTPTNITISSGSLPIDLDNDGASDFVINDRFDENGNYKERRLLQIVGQGQPGAAAIARNNIKRQAFALPSQFPIGPNSPRQFSSVTHPLSMAYASCRCISSESYKQGGLWGNVTDRYLGLRFQINGETHYGWARLTVTATGFGPRLKANLTGYAYEVTPDTTILAGDTGTARPAAQAAPEKSEASLGDLGRGASGLDAWRKP